MKMGFILDVTFLSGLALAVRSRPKATPALSIGGLPPPPLCSWILPDYRCRPGVKLLEIPHCRGFFLMSDRLLQLQIFLTSVL